MAEKTYPKSEVKKLLDALEVHSREVSAVADEAQKKAEKNSFKAYQAFRNKSGEFDDPHPEITALCLPGFMRSVMLFGSRGLDQRTVVAQITRLVERGVCGGEGNDKVEKRNVAVATGRNGR